MTDTTHDDLVKRLTITAGVMEMGEMIAWGSDTALMREAAYRIEELETKLAKVTAERDEELNQLGSARYTIDALKTYIKELKGQDYE